MPVSIFTTRRQSRCSSGRFRAFSHGCIRLERPLDLARYLLRDQAQWTAAAIEEAIESGRERTIRLSTPQPVYVLYWTAWVGDDGHMEFHRDHYERDAAIAAAFEHSSVTAGTSQR